MGVAATTPEQIDTRFGVDEAVFLLITAVATWAGNEFGEGADASPWFGQTPFGVPMHYVLFGLLLIVAVPYVLASPRFPLTSRLREMGLLWPLFAGAAAMALSLTIGILRGVPELFADWRNLVVTAVTAVYAGKWLAGRSWKRFVVTDLATLYGLLAIPDLVEYALGGGTFVLGVRTPVFEGTALYLASFSAIVAAWTLLESNPGLGARRTLWLRLGGIAGSLLVLTSFRRSFWLVWGIGLIFVVFLYLRSRDVRPARLFAAAIGAAILVFAAVATLGTETVVPRLGSFLPTGSGPYSATNEDHLNDIADAWTIISEDPILGFGIGRRYETSLIADWKTESFEVHNAVLHVWLKFGIAGAVVYVWFHLALVRAAARRRHMAPVGAFIVAQLAATVFGTWPYGRFQMAIFLGLVIASISVAPAISAKKRPAPLELEFA
ncbi:MAG: O-antigen ligase family protein [Acidimicrobiia bacterium]